MPNIQSTIDEMLADLDVSNVCDSCEYDYTAYGSECCDSVGYEYGISCAELENNYEWDCSGCNCTIDPPECGDGFCNGDESYDNCPDDCCADDEYNCGTNNGSCISIGLQCDGNDDCYNGVDEVECHDTSTLDVLYYSDADIYGFQFNMNGVSMISAGGGDAEAYGFNVAASAFTAIGFSLSGATIPAGSGVLTTLQVEGDLNDACLSNLILSGYGGQALEYVIVDCLSISYSECVGTSTPPAYCGCIDPEAFNYDIDAAIDDGSCEYEYLLGDLNGDGGWNVLDVVALANCVLASNCGDLDNGYAGDMNGDGGWNVLDVVALANCVLAANCSEY